MGAAGSWSEGFRTAAPAGGMAPYEDIMVPRLFAPWAEVLLDRVEVEPGLAVLDVACGPGTVARLASARVGPYGAVTGCDVSAAMLAIARSKPAVEDGAAIDYVECSADALAVPDDRFDIVTCQHGLQFFPTRGRALAEMRRAGRPGARLGVAVWAPIELSPVFAGLARAVARVLGEQALATYVGGPYALTDRAELEALVATAGFSDVTVQDEVVAVSFEGGPAQVLATLAITALAPQVAALDETGHTHLLEAAEEEMAPLVVDGGVHSDTTARILTATV